MNYQRHLITILVLAIVPMIANCQIIINEVCSKNNNTISDFENDFPDWIELYNTDDDDIDLEDWYISDDPSDLRKFKLPEVELDENEFILIFCSGKNLISNNEIHTNFKLDSEGETIYLTYENDKSNTELEIPSLRSDISYGRSINTENSYVYFLDATPNAPNSSNDYVAYTLDPIFSQNSGFYNNSVEIELSNNSFNTETFYSFGGNSPMEIGVKYDNPINIDSTCVICATSIKPNFLPSREICKSFFVNENKYMPVLSLICHPDSLWSHENGIFAMGPNADTVYPFWGANFWLDKTISAKVDYFDNKNLAFSGTYGIKTHGGRVSRTQAQKPFRIIADNKYGADVINYQVFPDKVNKTYKTLVLRNSGGDWNRAHFRDGIIHKTVIEDSIDIDVLAFLPIVLYINGEYWGIMNLREKVNKDYINDNYNINTENLDLLEEDTLVVEGDFDYFDYCYDYIVNNNLTNESSFKIAENMFDLASLSDYFITETYFNNTDWPGNNIKYWCSSDYNNKWRYIMFDLDPTLNNYGWASESFDELGYLFTYYLDINRHVQILHALLKNDEYEKYFISRYADLMNSTYSVDSLSTKTDNLVEYFRPEINNHFELWGGNNTSWWNNYHLPLVYRFIEERPFYARQYLQNQFNLNNQVEISITTNPSNIGKVKLNTLELNNFPWSGIYFDEIPVSIKAEGSNGFEFKNFQLSDGTTVSSDSISKLFVQNESIIINFVNNNETYTSISPNPCTNFINLEIFNKEQSHITVKIFDIFGKTVYLKTFDNYSAGFHEINFDDIEFDSGIYLLEISTESFIETHKLLIQ